MNQHRYDTELQKLSYPNWQMLDASNISACATDTEAISALHKVGHPFSHVRSTAELQEMLEEIEDFQEIAVDLEHNAARSFQGLTCLMQLSTREKDYIVDTLVLRSQLHVLNRVFCDPKIVKVFHGCAHDIMWLQRDLGLYVVNCFDTFQAAKALELPTLSLAHLLKSFCHITADKKYQMADWRTRPLSEEMLRYARDDTHFLLFVYDCLRRQLWQQLGQEGYRAVLDASKDVCASRYEKPRFYPLGFKKLLKGKSKGKRLEREKKKHGLGGGACSIAALSSSQDICLGALWAWRDATAREEDESPTQVLSNSDFLAIGMAVPTTKKAFMQLPRIDQGVQNRAEDILGVINGAVGIAGGSVVVVSAQKSPKAPKEKGLKRKALAPSLPPSVNMIEPFDVVPPIGSKLAKFSDQVVSVDWFKSKVNGKEQKSLIGDFHLRSAAARAKATGGDELGNKKTPVSNEHMLVRLQGALQLIHAHTTCKRVVSFGESEDNNSSNDGGKQPEEKVAFVDENMAAEQKKLLDAMPKIEVELVEDENMTKKRQREEEANGGASQEPAEATNSSFNLKVSRKKYKKDKDPGPTSSAFGVGSAPKNYMKMTASASGKVVDSASVEDSTFEYSGLSTGAMAVLGSTEKYETAVVDKKKRDKKKGQKTEKKEKKDNKDKDAKKKKKLIKNPYIKQAEAVERRREDTYTYK